MASGSACSFAVNDYLPSELVFLHRDHLTPILEKEEISMKVRANGD